MSGGQQGQRRGARPQGEGQVCFFLGGGGVSIVSDFISKSDFSL